MWILWVVLFGVGNLAIGGVFLWALNRRETQPQTAPALPAGVQQTLALLQQLAGEVTTRVEDNAGKLDGVVRELAAIAADSDSLSPQSLGSLRRSVKQQEEFAAYLRQSGREFRQHGSRLAVETGGGSSDHDPQSAGNASPLTGRGHASFREEVGAALAATQSANANRRGEQREVMTFTMSVLPLDDNQRPDGTPFVAVARDISTGGMSFSHTGPLSCPYLAVRMTLVGVQDICLVMVRRHTSPVGPMFITGGAFVSRLEEGRVWELLSDFAATSNAAPMPRQTARS